MIQVIVNQSAEIKGSLTPEAEAYLKKNLTLPNPEYQMAKKQMRSTRNMPLELYFLKRTSQGWKLPRGFSAQLTRCLRFHQLPYEVIDNTRLLPEVDFSFKGELHSFQTKAVEAILARRFGVLTSPTGSGKTIIALYTAAQRRQPTLVVCHTKELLHQWKERAMEFLGLSTDQIGLIGDGNSDFDKPFTIAIINSLYKCAKKIGPKIGFVIVDECHRVPSRTFTEAIEAFDSRFMLGLSATAYRRDNLTRMIYYYLGDRVYEIEPQELQKLNKIMQAQLIIRETGFSSHINASQKYQALITDLTENTARNQLIVDDVIREVKRAEGVCLVLSDRKEHCQRLFDLIIKAGHPVELLTGSTPRKQREKIVRELEQGLTEILIATGSLIGEGFDCKRLHSLFMTTPVKFTGRVTQYLGRILRTAKGKTQPKVYDYLDTSGVLQHSFKSRCYAYENMGVVKEEDSEENEELS